MAAAPKTTDFRPSVSIGSDLGVHARQPPAATEGHLQLRPNVATLGYRSGVYVFSARRFH